MPDEELKALELGVVPHLEDAPLQALADFDYVGLGLRTDRDAQGEVSIEVSSEIEFWLFIDDVRDIPQAQAVAADGEIADFVDRAKGAESTGEVAGRAVVHFAQGLVEVGASKRGRQLSDVNVVTFEIDGPQIDAHFFGADAVEANLRDPRNAPEWLDDAPVEVIVALAEIQVRAQSDF